MGRTVSDDAAIAVYLLVLWIATFGIMAPASSRSIVCRRSKQLGAVTFAVLVIETVRISGSG